MVVSDDRRQAIVGFYRVLNRPAPGVDRLPLRGLDPALIHVFPPLDSSPLSVEFFHDGVAGVKIDWPDAASFTGTKLTIGYQIGLVRSR